jgi:hypothetical protein
MAEDKTKKIHAQQIQQSDPSSIPDKKSEAVRLKAEIVGTLRRQLDRIINDAPQHQLPIGAINCYYYCQTGDKNGYIAYTKLEADERAQKDRDIMEWLLTNNEHLKQLSDENIELLHKDMPIVDKIINYFGGDISELQHCYTDEIEWYKKAQQEVFSFKRLKNEYEKSKEEEEENAKTVDDLA